MLLLLAHERPAEVERIERLKIFDSLSHADAVDGKLQLVRD